MILKVLGVFLVWRVRESPRVASRALLSDVRSSGVRPRRCFEVRRDGQTCRAWAMWDDTKQRFRIQRKSLATPFGQLAEGRSGRAIVRAAAHERANTRRNRVTGYYESSHQAIFRVGLEPGTVLPFTGDAATAAAAKLKRFDYVVLGDATTQQDFCGQA